MDVTVLGSGLVPRCARARNFSRLAVFLGAGRLAISRSWRSADRDEAGHPEQDPDRRQSDRGDLAAVACQPGSHPGSDPDRDGLRPARGEHLGQEHQLEQLLQFGIGLAVAAILDATVIRGLLVPARMIMLGQRQVAGAASAAGARSHDERRVTARCAMPCSAGATVRRGRAGPGQGLGASAVHRPSGLSVPRKIAKA
jgi:hypothetical protein